MMPLKSISSMRFFVATMALTVCVALLAGAPSAAWAGEQQTAAPQRLAPASSASLAVQKVKVHKVRTAADWRNIGMCKGGTFKVMRDIKLTSEEDYLTIKKNKRYTIDLNGHKVATTYGGVALRTECPLYVAKGTVVLKSGKKNKGVLYSTESSAVTVANTATFYLKGANVVDNATEVRSDAASGIVLSDNAKGFVQGKSRIRSVGCGISLMNAAKLTVTGNPRIRAGADGRPAAALHFGSGIRVASANARLTLKGGSFGTKADPDTGVSGPGGTFAHAAADYPILDQAGQALGNALPKGYEFADAKGKRVQVKGSSLSEVYDGASALGWDALLAGIGMSSEKHLETTAMSSDGYYTVRVRKK